MRHFRGGDFLQNEKNIRSFPDEALLPGLFRCFLFAPLSEKERKEALVAANPLSVAFSAKEVIVKAGTPFPYLGYIAKGEATVSRVGEKHAVTLSILKEGDLFGASALFGNSTRFPTNVTAKTNGALLLIEQAAVEELLVRFPSLAKAYVSYLSEKIRFLNRRLDVLAGRSTEEKVAAFLLHNTERSNALPVQKTALSSLLGLGRASLYRVLDSLEEQKIIRSSRSEIEILNKKELEKILEENQ